jgi:hypothetical protein
MQQDNARKLKQQNKALRIAKRRKLREKMKIDGLGEYGLDFNEDVQSDEDEYDEEEYGSEVQGRAEGGQLQQ